MANSTEANTLALPTLSNLKVSSSSSSSSSSSNSVEIKVTSLSGVINGKFGAFRSLKIGDDTYSVDDKRVQGAGLFTPNCNATLVLNSYKNSAGELKTVISQLTIHPPTACGYFVMR